MEKYGIVDLQEIVNDITKDSNLRIILPKTIFELPSREEQDKFIEMAKRQNKLPRF